MALNSFTNTTSIGWGSRLMNSIKSVLFGVVIFFGSFFLLWWNEGNSIRTATGLTEGAHSVVKIAADKVSPENNGKLVHLSGDVKTDEFLDDADFNVHVNALKLTRLVQMYQWTEKTESKETKKVGGSSETTTTYTYTLTWADGRVNSDDFNQQEGHINPPLPIESQMTVVNKATLGAFTLNQSLLSSVDDHEPYPLSSLESTKYKDAKIGNDGAFIGKGSPESPEVGDIKVSFSIVKPGPVSIIAQQDGESFVDFVTSTGTTISLLDHGIVPPEKMFEEAQSANTMMTWILRGVGFFAMFLGLTLTFKPLVVLADVLPFLGSLLGVGVGLFAFAIALLLSSLTIAIAWVFYRPILGISLLVIGVGAFVMIYRWSKKKRDERLAATQPQRESAIV